MSIPGPIKHEHDALHEGLVPTNQLGTGIADSTTYLAGDQTWQTTPSGTPSFATPAIVLSTTAAAGVATTVIRSDSTIAAFDTTVPTTITSGASAATGSAAFAARRDHVHGIGTFQGEVVMVSGSSPPDPVLNSAGDDWVYGS